MRLVRPGVICARLSHLPLWFAVRASDVFSRDYPSRCAFCPCLAVYGPYSASGGVVGLVTGDARVGEVWRGGSVDKVDGKGAAVMNVGSGGEGDGAGGEIEVSRVNDLLTREDAVEGAGVVLGGVGVGGVDHEVSPAWVWMCFLVWLHCSMFRGCVHGVSRSCGARVGRVFGHVGGAGVGA